MKGEAAARQRLEALEARISQLAVPLPPAHWQLRDQIRQTLENAHAEGLLEQAVHQIKPLYRSTEPDARGFMTITGGKRAETWDAGDQLARDDGARFNFTVVARYAKAAHPELIAYHFNLAFPGGQAPAFVRFDCNEAHFADAARDASRSPLRCHSHPGHADMTVPSPVLSPLEILDLILRHHLRRPMSARPAIKKNWTSEEYLAWERLQPEKHEFHGGEVFEMARATFAHSLIVANISAELGGALRQKLNGICASNMRLKVPATGLYTYPDASVVCGPPEFEDATRDTLLNPLILVEVLSPSTEDYDRGTKFTNYRTIASLRDYVLVSTDKVLVEYHTRQEDGSWVLREFRAGERFKLESVGVELAVDELYMKVLDAPAGA